MPPCSRFTPHAAPLPPPTHPPTPFPTPCRSTIISIARTAVGTVGVFYADMFIYMLIILFDAFVHFMLVRRA